MNKVIEFPGLRSMCKGEEVSLQEAIETVEKNLCMLVNEFTMPAEEGFVVDKAKLAKEAWLKTILIKVMMKDEGLL